MLSEYENSGKYVPKLKMLNENYSSRVLHECLLLILQNGQEDMDALCLTVKEYAIINAFDGRTRISCKIFGN